LDSGEPAKEPYASNDTQKKKFVHDKDLDLRGETVANNIGHIHSPSREGVKFSGKFICGGNLPHFIVCIYECFV
jgi:hypothetical protein